MLIRFEAKNFRSIAQPVELSMVAVDHDRPAARAVPSIGESLLTTAAVFGPNASGKSNVLAALAWVRQAVDESVRQWENRIPWEPFAFGTGPTTPAEFAVECAVGGVRFEYLLELDAERVRYEGLFHYPEKKRRRIFERDGLDLKLQRGLGALSGTRELLTNSTLALSVARRFGEPLIDRFSAGLQGIEILETGASRIDAHYWLKGFPAGSRATMDWFERAADPAERNRALTMLRLADLGIEDVVIENQEVRWLGSADTGVRRWLRLLHRTADGSMPLEFAAESQGTRAWFGIVGPLLEALDNGSLVLVDELDASLHPKLTAEILRIFQDPLTNPHGAQLVFTSHDTSLLNHLNRDEVWLTEKRGDGSTRLGALADFAGERVRKSQNLESAYLHGRFGALPRVDQADFLRALGLTG